MPDASLSIQVGADVSGFVQNLGQADAALAGTTVAVNDFGDTLLGLSAQLKALQAQRLTISDAGQLAAINKDILTLEGGIERIKNVGKAGFDEFGEAVGQTDRSVTSFLGTNARARVAFLDLGRVVTGQGFSLRSLASNFTLFNPLVIVAAAGIGLLAKELIDANEREKELQKTNQQFQAAFGTAIPLNINIEEAKAKLEAYNKIVQDTVSSTGKEAAQVDILVARLQTGNLTRGETVDVIKKLQQIAPDYFGKLDAEKASVDQITTAYNNYNRALVANVEAQIRVAEISDLVKQRLDTQRQFPEASKFINDQLAAGKSLDDVTKSVLKTYQGQQDKLIQLGQANKVITNEQQKQLLSQGAPLGADVILNQLQQEKKLLDEIADANLKSIGVKDKDPSGKDNSLQNEIALLENIKKLRTDLEKTDERPLFKQESDAIDPATLKLATDKIALAEQEGVKKGLDPALVRTQVDLMNKEFDRLLNPDLHAKINVNLAETGPGENAELKKFADNEGKQLTDYLKKLPPLKPHIKVEPDLTLDRKLLDEFNKELSTSVSSGLENLGSSIGTALGKGQNAITAAAHSILGSLGDLIEKLGKSLITYGLVKTGLDQVLKEGFGLPGAAAIAIGVGAVALGALVKAESSNFHAFAEGGVVTGPTYGLIGEAGPEAIFPLSKLNQFVKGVQSGGSDGFVASTKISGNDLNILIARANKNKNLAS